MLRSLVAPDALAGEDERIIRRNLTQEKLETILTRRGECLWIDIVDPSEEEIHWLEQCLNLHPAVVSDLMREDRRPTLLVYPDYLFLSLFQPRFRLQKLEGEEIHCLIGEQYFVTVRRTNGNSVDNAYERAAQNPNYWERGNSYLLYLTAQFAIDSYYPLLDRINTQLNELEEKILANGSGKALQRSVYRIKNQLISLREMVAPQREVLSSMIGEDRLTKTVENRDLFRHLYERLLRVYDVIDSQRDLATNILDLIESQEAGRLAEAVSRLTIFSMIFLPLTFLVGLFGLNFITTEPELRIPFSGDFVFVGILLATIISAGILVWLFRRKGWL